MVMIFPLEELENYTGNIYEITVAATKYAQNMMKKAQAGEGATYQKVVSLAAKDVFTHKIRFEITQK